MTFKKSGNSRDDRSSNSSRRSSGSGADNNKKSFSSSRPKTASSGFKKSESADDRPKKKFDGEASGDKKSFNKNFNKPDGKDGDKKYKGKPSGDFKSRPYGAKDFSEGAFKKEGAANFKRTPYGTRDSSGSSSSEGGSDFKRKPYGTRDTSDSSSRQGGSDFKRKPYGTRDSSDSSPREGGFKKEGSDFKRKPSGSKDFSERPPREGGFKKEGADFKRKPSGSKDFSERLSRESGFKRDGDAAPKRKTTSVDDRPFRARSASNDGDPKRTPYNREDRSGDKPKRVTPKGITEPGEEKPERTLRGRKKAPEADKGKIRLNRYISNAGICSRRKADELIVAGVVAVNGEVITELGHKVDPYKDEVRYNGETLKREKMVYVLLNKPKDYITTTEDPQERRTVMHLVEKASKERIYPVGRLDRNTTGLLLMTNDGDLADKLSHPRSNITKLYQVELDKSLSQGDMNKIGFGLELEDGLIKPDSVSYVQGGSKREIGIQIHSGKNRVVRRIFEHLGYDVVKLDRAVYANLTKKDLPRGRWRYLEDQEIIQLKHLIK